MQIKQNKKMLEFNFFFLFSSRFYIFVATAAVEINWLSNRLNISMDWREDVEIGMNNFKIPRT